MEYRVCSQLFSSTNFFNVFNAFPLSNDSRAMATHSSIGYAVMMVLFTLEKRMTPAPVNIFFLRMCFPCTRLYYQGIRAGDEILFPLCCVAAAFVLGLFLMRRKNMLKKEAD